MGRKIEEDIAGESLTHGVLGHGGGRRVLGGGIEVDAEGRIPQYHRGSSTPASMEQLLQFEGYQAPKRMAHQMEGQGCRQPLQGQTVVEIDGEGVGTQGGQSFLLGSSLAMAGQIGTKQEMVFRQMGGQLQHRAPIQQGAMEEHQQGGWTQGSAGTSGGAPRGSPTARITRQGLP